MRWRRGRRAALSALFGLIAHGVLAQDTALPALPAPLAEQFQAIGRIGQPDFPTQGCTGTLIAPDLVLTAAHCVAEDGPSTNIFAPGWREGRAVTARRFKQEIRHPDYGAQGTHDPDNDVALIVLNAPITQVAPIPMAPQDAGALADATVALLGYHIQSPDRLSGRLLCNTKDMVSGLVHVACPVVQGNSGSPILAADDSGRWQVVGVISSRIGRGAVAIYANEWLQTQIAAHLGQ